MGIYEYKAMYVGQCANNVAIAFQAVVERAGIGHATPHYLRNTAINLVDISKVVGQKKLGTTMKYVHTAEERLHDVVANLPTIARLRKT